MIEHLTERTFLFTTQAVVFSILSFVFFMYYRTFKRQYVGYWLISLVSLTATYFLKAIVLHMPHTLEVDVELVIIETLHLSLLFSFLFYLTLGVLSAKNKKVLSFKQTCSFIVFIFAFSVVLITVEHTDSFNHFYLTVSLPSFIFGCIFFALATLLLFDKNSHLSNRILMWFFFIVGFRYLFYSFISIVALTDLWFPTFEAFLVFFNVAAESILGFTLLVWMQGAERLSALNAINRAQYLGEHDSLTGALNRTQVMAKLSEKISGFASEHKKNNKLAVFLIDIKQFKFINDTYGLKVGDYILGEIAARLNSSVFLPVAVGRLSGDSFMFVIEFEQQSHIDRAAQHIHELIERSYRFEQNKVNIQTSIGYCCYPIDAVNAEDLLQKANLALHHAETNDIATVGFEGGMQAQGRRLLLMKAALLSALKNDEFVLHFQPQLNLFTNKLEGVEALVRWQHPERGFLMPADFLDDIEALGMHNEFDNYILTKACQISARLFDLCKRRVAIAINITAVEFQDVQLVTNIQKLLEEHKIPSKYIELEITENVVMTDIERAMNSIVKMQSMGIKVSIDDFGTGYSSLAYLRKLPIDKIKIDRSFIAEVATNDSDLTIVKSMVDLSHGLGKRVLAEGVETIEQLNILRNLGCDAVQGYFISKPISEAELVRHLTKK
ncbi:EAL domain-containing protein [Colwellia sp. D2M02]|uniref:putative bifunctional diguanylate cyclase/phosphodiesterase n=1 Tax=Colwellia sp. D2M02 TaxID=2841562 RepID=UPI001C086566|nr:GGDEF domain-containing phosphodiesterase [Colwellia sp. D2M02]MBU2893588.1 EAL domain-containing protein [Colwellia sp. D2M02]